jgi:FkbM family methyltransferase
MLLDLPTSHAAVLERMLEWGVKFDSFFDIGAATGMWGSMIRRHWPESDIYFFEAAPAWRLKLEAAAQALGGNAEVMIAAVGDIDGETFFRFDPANPYGGAIVNEPAENTIRVGKIRLDSFVQDRSPKGRFALKLDVHGAERQILAGADKFMTRCDLVIFETYNFGPATRRFGQMAVFFEERYGLRCIDIAEPKWRPYDRSLWQIDLYFVRPEGTTLAEWRL